MKCSRARFSLLDAGPRPTGERWLSKTWACSRAMEQVVSEWVLFVDADVRLRPPTLRRALAQAMTDGADLLSLAPRLSCGCLAEWLVQPIMASLLGLGFPIEAANDPASPVAFAAGPFMLFRHSAYVAIGGHLALAAEVVEDLALARRFKQGGHRLRYLLGLDALELRMSSDFTSHFSGRFRTRSRRSLATTNACAWRDGSSLRGQIRGGLCYRGPYSRQWAKRFAVRSPRSTGPPYGGCDSRAPDLSRCELCAAGFLGPDGLHPPRIRWSADSSPMQTSGQTRCKPGISTAPLQKTACRTGS